MQIRTRLAALLTLAAIGAAGPALAQDVPADANKSLWCATAFGIVEPQARQSGDTASADNFKKYNATLVTTSNDALKKAGFTDDQIKATSTKYIDTVTKEISQGGSPEFSIIDCTALVDPAAAAAIQQPPAAPADGAAAPAPAAPTAPAAPAN